MKETNVGQEGLCIKASVFLLKNHHRCMAYTLIIHGRVTKVTSCVNSLKRGVGRGHAERSACLLLYTYMYSIELD